MADSFPEFDDSEIHALMEEKFRNCQIEINTSCNISKLSQISLAEAACDIYPK